MGKSKAIEVENNHDEIVGGNYSIFIGPSNIGYIVSSAFSKKTEGLGHLSRKIGLDHVLAPGRNHFVLGVEKSKSETVGLSLNEIVGVSKTVAVGQHSSINAGEIVHLHSSGTLVIDAQRLVSLTGVERVEVAAGQARIILERKGKFRVFGSEINLGASGAINIDAKGELRISGKRVDNN